MGGRFHAARPLAASRIDAAGVRECWRRCIPALRAALRMMGSRMGLPSHGRIACRRCFAGTDEVLTLGKWRVVNDPGAWGSATPTVLVLGFSKGFTQAT